MDYSYLPQNYNYNQQWGNSMMSPQSGPPANTPMSGIAEMVRSLIGGYVGQNPHMGAAQQQAPQAGPPMQLPGALLSGSGAPASMGMGGGLATQPPPMGDYNAPNTGAVMAGLMGNPSNG